MRYFFRNGVACLIAPSEDNWSHQVFLGIEPDHQLAGKIFVPRTKGPSLHHVSHFSGNVVLDNKWWFNFEGTKADVDSTMKELDVAAKELEKD